MENSNKKGKEGSNDSGKHKTKKDVKETTSKPKQHGKPKDTSKGVERRVQKIKNVFEGKSTANDEDMDFSDTASIKERRLSDSSLKGVSWVTSETNEEKGEFHEPVQRTRSNTTNKEMWVPLAIKDTNIEDKGKAKSKKPTSPEPIKPPRPKRVSSFKHNTKDDKEVKMRKSKENAIDPVKPPRRKLPRLPGADTKMQKGEKHKGSKEELSEGEQAARDIISRPVVMSTPFQENMTLSVEDMTNNGEGRRLFSIYDDSTDTTVQQGVSFYDYLYSKKDDTTKELGAYGGNQTKDFRDENLYDDVPLDSSTQSLASIEQRTNTDFDIYDEVIVNKGEQT